MAFVAIMIVVCAASTGHAVVINGERQVQAQTYVPSAVNYKQSEVTAEQFRSLEKKYKILNEQVNGKKGLTKRMGAAEDNIEVAQGTADRAEKKVNTLGQYVGYLHKYLVYLSENHNKGVDTINSTAKIARATAKSAVTTGGAIVAAVILFLGFTAVVFGIFSFFERRRKKEQKAA